MVLCAITISNIMLVSAWIDHEDFWMGLAMKIFIYLLAAIFLPGCAFPSPEIKASTPRTVMMKHVTSRNLGEALSLAEKECMKHDKHATYTPDNSPDGMATFECVD